MIFKHQLRWSGHVHRMDDERIPKQIMLSQLESGTRDTGRPLQRFKDYLGYAMEKCGIKANVLNEQNVHLEPTRRLPSRTATNRTAIIEDNVSNHEEVKRTIWRNTVKDGVTHFEKTRIQDLKTKRAVRKAKSTNNAIN